MSSKKNDTNEIVQTLSNFFDFCGLRQNELALRAYTKAFIDRNWDAEKAKDILSTWIEKHGRKVPSISDLDEMLTKSSGTSARQLATQIASIVPQLISKHGYYWGEGCFHHSCGFYWSGNGGYAYPSFDAAVRSYLGDFAPIVTKSWRTLCEAWDDNPTTHFAQIRDRIESEIVSSEHMKEQAIALAHHQRELIAQGSKDILSIEQKTQQSAGELDYAAKE